MLVERYRRSREGLARCRAKTGRLEYTERASGQHDRVAGDCGGTAGKLLLGLARPA